MRSVYDWMMRISAGPNAPWALALVSFLESSIFPIPPDVMLVPMVLARRERAWLFADICTAATDIGRADFSCQVINGIPIAFLNQMTAEIIGR